MSATIDSTTHESAEGDESAVTAPPTYLGDLPAPSLVGSPVSAGNAVPQSPLQVEVSYTVPSWTAESWANRPERRIAVIGFTQSREDAPWGDSSWEMWGLNNLHLHTPPERMASFTRWYDLHPLDTIRSDAAHVAWLERAQVPVFVWQPQPEWPTSVRFPKEPCVDQFGQYFTNSISWMLAHALLEGVTHLGVWGVDMAQGTEYAAQRPSCEYFLGLAAGLGIEVTIAETSDLLKSANLYGESDSGLRVKLEQRSAELRGRVADAEQRMEAAKQEVLMLRGAIESNDYILHVWTQPSARRDSGGPRDPNLGT